MTERGRGSGSFGDDPNEVDAVEERTSDRHPVPPTAARPIAPYDPYRPPSGDMPRRNVAAGDLDPARRSSRAADRDVFLPDDDPLNAEAWQLELDEMSGAGDDPDALPAFDRETPPPRRARRQPAAPRTGRERRAAAGATRRGKTAAAGMRDRVTRPSVTLGVPRVVAGSSLVTDRAVLALIGVNAASILIMALLLGVRLGGIPSPIVLQLDAAGNPDLWGPPSVLWRLPVMAFFITVMFLTVAWFLHPIDRFAARFALAAALVAQLVAWVAVVQHLA